MLGALELGPNSGLEFVQGVETEVGKGAALEPGPQELDRIEVRRVSWREGTYSGGCVAPQTPTRLPCTARIYESIAGTSPASYPLRTAGGTPLGAATL